MKIEIVQKAKLCEEEQNREIQKEKDSGKRNR